MANTEALIATANALPTLPMVFATDMLHAQGYTPTVENRRDITAHADFQEACGLPRTVRIKVLDIFAGGAAIGYLEVTI